MYYDEASAQATAGHCYALHEAETDTMNLRASPSFKKMLIAVAEEGNRSMASVLEVIVKDYCQRRAMLESEAPDLRINSHG